MKSPLCVSCAHKDVIQASERAAVITRRCVCVNRLHRIAQGTAETREPTSMTSPSCELDTIAEAQMRAEKMHVHIARPAMQFELEMMMLEIAQAVGHFFLAGGDLLRPELDASRAECSRSPVPNENRGVNHSSGPSRQVRSLDPARLR